MLSPPAWSGGRPSTSHDSASASGIGGSLWMRTSGAASRARYGDTDLDRESGAQRQDVEPGVLRRALEVEPAARDLQLLPEALVDAVDRFD